jgi:hypothetical protein
MFGNPRKTVHPARNWMSLTLSLALMVLTVGVSLILYTAGAWGQGGNAATLANLRGQIQRYGCNLPQYANSVAGCRSLHARVKSLQSGNGDTRSTRQPYTRPARYNSSGTSSSRTRRPAPPSSGGSLFASLFGGTGAYGSSKRYNTHRTPYQGLSGWSSTYPSYMRSYGRYRTLCVRTCDGYYWPVSFSTTRSGIARDANQCESSCQVPAKLFYHRNPGSDVQQMVDLQGKPYSSTENAFRYRAEYVPNCRCKPEPWSDAAKEVYERRAELAENPDALEKVADAGIAGAPAIKANGRGGYSGTNTQGNYYQAPQPRRRSRDRYSISQPGQMDRWSASSW